jgi:hypothetical protein
MDFRVLRRHALAGLHGGSQPLHEGADPVAGGAGAQALPDESFPAKMYDWIKAEYENNPDKDNWEKTRDRVQSPPHRNVTTDGYNYRSWFDAGINYGASLISLFYGEGDFKRTIQIGTLCGWDSDNPTATWGGLLGFMLGREGVEKQFPDKNFPVSTTFRVHGSTFPTAPPVNRATTRSS